MDVVVDTQLSIEELDTVGTVVTPCEAVVASTGTILLVHDGAQGRRAITLLPDHHICIVKREQVFEMVPEAIAAMGARSRMAITTISGPSATSDIEMTRIRGVHGPRRLTVVLYGRG
jgi:L-lactate dehydrogenase complex protein LldG